MVQHSIDDRQEVCRGFVHLLGVWKSTDPLNGLSRLKSQHSGPHLGLIYSQSNQSNIENTTDALRVQTDLNSFNIINDRATHAIIRPRIKCLHQSRENQLRNSDHRKPTHHSKQTIEFEMLKLGKINISPRNYSSLSKMLFVSLVVLHRTEQGGVKPHLLVSLLLRRLNWTLALYPRGSRLSSRSHMEEEAREQWLVERERRSQLKP